MSIAGAAVSLGCAVIVSPFGDGIVTVTPSLAA